LFRQSFVHFEHALIRIVCSGLSAAVYACAKGARKVAKM
jgi:hypothetical protein